MGDVMHIVASCPCNGHRRRGRELPTHRPDLLTAAVRVSRVTSACAHVIQRRSTGNAPLFPPLWHPPKRAPALPPPVSHGTRTRQMSFAKVSPERAPSVSRAAPRAQLGAVGETLHRPVHRDPARGKAPRICSLFHPAKTDEFHVEPRRWRSARDTMVNSRRLSYAQPALPPTSGATSVTAAAPWIPRASGTHGARDARCPGLTVPRRVSHETSRP